MEYVTHDCDLLAIKTVKAFENYLQCLSAFKKEVGLIDVSNIHEICNAMTDKHGRLCRHVKHVERKDPKEEWPTEAIESIAGYMAYALMFINYYKLNDFIYVNMLSELQKSIRQHARKK